MTELLGDFQKEAARLAAIGEIKIIEYKKPLLDQDNLSGETIAFGGRIIKEGKFAKYINSPETEFYKKGNVVFNLDKAKDLRTETNEVIIVEGYMDVIS